MPPDIRSFFGGKGDRVMGKEPQTNKNEPVRIFFSQAGVYNLESSTLTFGRKACENLAQSKLYPEIFWFLVITDLALRH